MEVELKLLLEPGEAGRLRERFGGPLRVEQQSNRYFDDEERSLARARWGLRVRVIQVDADPARTVLTLKHSGEEVGDFRHRPEYETSLAPSELEPSSLLAIARELLPDPSVLPSVQLREIGRMENRREVFALGKTGLSPELDRTTWPDGSVSEELELEIDEPADADEAVRSLRGIFEELGIDWRVGRESKLQRLLRML